MINTGMTRVCLVVTCLIVADWSVAAPAWADIVAHYTFDIDARDETGGHDGQLIDGAFAGVDDPLGDRTTGVLELDGLTGYVAVPDDDELDLTDNFTLAAWINVNGTATGHIVRKIADNDTTDHLYVLRTQADTLRFFVGDEFLVSSNLISDPAPFSIGDWHFVAATFDGFEQAIYVDSSEPLAVMESLVPEAMVSDNELRIGRGEPAGYFDGLIDDVWIFNHVLSTEELDDLIAGVPVGGTPLRAGDANMDLQFNQLDLVQVQIAAKYLTGQAATWGEGDWDAAPGGSPGDPPAGNGRFDQLDIIAALAAGTYLTGPYAAIVPGGQAADEQTSIIFKATFGSSFGSLSFGNVAQSGLSEQLILGDLSVVGSLAGGGDLGEVDLIYIPEPSSLLLALLGIAGLLFRPARRF